MDELIFVLVSLNVHNGAENSPSNHATFRAQAPRSGSFQLPYQDWVHRGRPTEIVVALPTG